MRLPRKLDAHLTAWRRCSRVTRHPGGGGVGEWALERAGFLERENARERHRKGTPAPYSCTSSAPGAECVRWGHNILLSETDEFTRNRTAGQRSAPRHRKPGVFKIYY